MSNENKIVSFGKNTKGDLIFEINPQNINATRIIKVCLSFALKVLLPIFSFFDFLASKKKLVISAVGLGIGLGLSVLVTQRPDTLQAFPSSAITQNIDIRAERLVISSIDLSTHVVAGNVQDLFDNVTIETLVHDERSSELGGVTPVVIAQVGVQDILKDITAVKIGDEIQIQGSNNAAYTYRVTEIRDMKAEYLPNIVGANTNSVILYKSKNILRTQLYILIAKPVF